MTAPGLPTHPIPERRHVCDVVLPVPRIVLQQHVNGHGAIFGMFQRSGPLLLSKLLQKRHPAHMQSVEEIQRNTNWYIEGVW